MMCFVWGVGDLALAGRPRPHSGVPPVFIAPTSGPALERYFGCRNGRAALVGNAHSSSIVAFSAYTSRHPTAVLRWIGSSENWGRAYNEAAEFVPAGEFLYNTGWYTGGHDGLYHPGDFGWDLSRHFASIHVTQCTIQTPAGSYDLTHTIDPGLGEPYALSIVPPYSYNLHCEADLVDDDSGALLFHFVHDQRWDPPKPTFDSAFHGRRIQSAVRQTESWWDSRGVTLHNSGASYALDLGCFWQIFANENRCLDQMIFSWTL
jgi:hypothetical protein